jgi:hypothetical protein
VVQFITVEVNGSLAINRCSTDTQNPDAENFFFDKTTERRRADRRGSLACRGDTLLECVPHGGAVHYGKMPLTGLESLDPSMLIEFMVRD